MSSTITFDQIYNRSLFAEGILAIITALKAFFLSSLIKFFGVKFLIYLLKFIEETLDLQELDRERVEKIYPVFKDLHDKFQNTLPVLLGKNKLFSSKKDLGKLRHYYEFIEDVLEAMEIGLDTISASKIEALANEADCSEEISPWGKALEQI